MIEPSAPSERYATKVDLLDLELRMARRWLLTVWVAAMILLGTLIALH